MDFKFLIFGSRFEVLRFQGGGLCVRGLGFRLLVHPGFLLCCPRLLLRLVEGSAVRVGVWRLGLGFRVSNVKFMFQSLSFKDSS